MQKNYSQTFSNTLVVRSKIFSKTVLFLFLLFSSVVIANPPAFNDDVDDQAPPAEIDSYLVILCVVGILLGLYLLRKKELLKTHHQ